LFLLRLWDKFYSIRLKMFFYSGGQECQAINPSNFGLNLDDISGFSRTEIFS